MNKSYTYYSLSRKRDGIVLLLAILLAILTFTARAQEGSQGNTTVFNGAQMTFSGPHTFLTGGTGSQVGIIKTIRTAPVGILSYGTAATQTAASDAGHIDGYAGKYGTTAFTFPIGNGTKLRTVGISAPVTSVFFKAAYWFSNPNVATLPAGAPFPVANLGTGVTAVSNIEYWDIDGPSAVNLTLSWDAASSLSTLTSGTIANLVVVGYNPSTSKWESLGNAGGTTGTLASTGAITANSVIPDAYSVFTFGVAVAVTVPDLTPTIDVSAAILSVGSSSSIEVYIGNIKAALTTSAVIVTITKPSGSSGLTLTFDSSPDWTITQTTTAYTFTLIGTIPSSGLKLFTGTINRTGGTAGDYNFTPVIANNSGGETNNLNNRSSTVFTKN